MKEYGPQLYSCGMDSPSTSQNTFLVTVLNVDSLIPQILPLPYPNSNPKYLVAAVVNLYASGYHMTLIKLLDGCWGLVLRTFFSLEAVMHPALCLNQILLALGLRVALSTAWTWDRVSSSSWKSWHSSPSSLGSYCRVSGVLYSRTVLGSMLVFGDEFLW